MKKLLFFIILLLPILSFSQKQMPVVEILTEGVSTSLRGLSVVNDNVIWVSGSNGTVARSTNGGKDWKWLVIKGFENNDFRDIEAFDATTAVIMSVGEPAYILRTVDGGESWTVVYENMTEGIFLDAMEFWNLGAGIVVGDPINGRFFIARTFDGGGSWREIPFQYQPVADSGEACFAASGTNVRALDNDEAVFISGGASSHIFIRDQKIRLPIIQGSESTGANSIAVWDRFRRRGGNRLVVVGGDFTNDSLRTDNCFISHDRGKTWKSPSVPPYGYRSSVEFLDKKTLITCGLNGVDISFNGGDKWYPISKTGFHVTRIAKLGSAVYLAGPGGRIARVNFNPEP